MNIKAPKATLPLAKSFRTGEGILIYALNLVLGLGTIIDPSKLPPIVAAKWAGVLAVAHVIARTGLKIVAVQKTIGVDPPIDPQPLIDKIAAQVAAKTDAGPTVEDIKGLIQEAVNRGIASSVLGALAPAQVAARKIAVIPTGPSAPIDPVVAPVVVPPA